MAANISDGGEEGKLKIKQNTDFWFLLKSNDILTHMLRLKLMHSISLNSDSNDKKKDLMCFNKNGL